MYCTHIDINQKISVDLFSDNMFRLRKSDIENDVKYNIPFVIGHTDDWESVEYSLKKNNSQTHIKTKSLEIVVSDDGDFNVRNDGEQIYPSDEPAFGFIKNKCMVFDSASVLYETSKNSRYAHWFYNTDTRRYDVFLCDDVIYDIYFIYGETYEKLYQSFNILTGPVPMLPKKFYGYMQTEHPGEGGDQEQFIKLADDLRERKIPCDILLLDFEWGDTFDDEGKQLPLWGSSLKWSEKYAKPSTPEEMIKYLKDNNFEVILNMHSVPDFENRTTLGLYKRVPSVLKGFPWKVEEWTDALYTFMEQGVVGVWSDLRNQDITFAYIWSILRDYNPGKRIYFIQCYEMFLRQSWNDYCKRIPYTKLMGWHRYPIAWTGDCDYSWAELKFQIEAIANINGPLKGISYVSGDAYGKNGAIQVRWNQFLCFSPVIKNHRQRPWQSAADVGKELFAVQEDITETAALKTDDIFENTEDIIRKFIEIRYSLMPYIYTLAYEYTSTGMPMIRPLMIEFPDDVTCNCNQWPMEYMFGKSFLVAPVYCDAKTMEIYLPKGESWIDYFDGTVYEGGQIIDYDVSDLSRMPLFIRQGSIVVTMDKCCYLTDERPHKLYIDIYVAGSGEYVLYEDDAVTYEYKNGKCSKTFISYTENTDNVKVEIREENNCFNETDRDYVVRLHNCNKKSQVIIL